MDHLWSCGDFKNSLRPSCDDGGRGLLFELSGIDREAVTPRDDGTELVVPSKTLIKRAKVQIVEKYRLI